MTVIINYNFFYIINLFQFNFQNIFTNKIIIHCNLIHQSYNSSILVIFLRQIFTIC